MQRDITKHKNFTIFQNTPCSFHHLQIRYSKFFKEAKMIKLAIVLTTFLTLKTFGNCIVPELPKLPRGVITVSKSAFDFNYFVESTLEGEIGEIRENSRNFYTWYNSNGKVISTIDRKVIKTITEFNSDGEKVTVTLSQIKISNCVGEEMATISLIEEYTPLNYFGATYLDLSSSSSSIVTNDGQKFEQFKLSSGVFRDTARRVSASVKTSTSGFFYEKQTISAPEKYNGKSIDIRIAMAIALLKMAL